MGGGTGGCRPGPNGQGGRIACVFITFCLSLQNICESGKSGRGPKILLSRAQSKSAQPKSAPDIKSYDVTKNDKKNQLVLAGIKFETQGKRKEKENAYENNTIQSLYSKKKREQNCYNSIIIITDCDFQNLPLVCSV